MPKITWDAVGDRYYESGLDNGVLYLPDGSAVPWNGLTSINESLDRSAEAVFLDGSKINDVVKLGTFTATLSAVTYPNELDEINGAEELRSGVHLNEQPQKTFALCYRTKIGNDFEGSEAGYKIHIVYNITAIPSEKTYATASDDPSLVEFEWELFTTPEHIEGYRPSAYMVINTAELDPWLLEEIEAILYGTNYANASLLSMNDLVSYINNWFRIKITDNGNGTWTAETKYPGFIIFVEEGEFLIKDANAIFTEDDVYILSDTKDVKDAPNIKIVDNGDGTWTASTSNDNLIVTTSADGTYEIRDANVTYLDTFTYQLSDSF
jgi:hypothetical protein